MPCYSPRIVPNGSKNFKYGDPLGFKVPCSRCIGCRLERSRQWMVRGVLEQRYWDASSFITLTYRDEKLPLTTLLPAGGTLVKSHFQDFAKRLRARLEQKIKIMWCGEYGSETHRPHFHAIVFGESFEQGKIPWRRNELGQVSWRSPLLEEVWTDGHSDVGTATAQSIAYVARYITKKVFGEKAHDWYFGREKECFHPSNGIARRYIEEFMDDVYPHDGGRLVFDGRPMKPPRYFDKIYLEKRGQKAWDFLRAQRAYAALLREENYPEEFEVRRQKSLAAAKEAIVKKHLLRKLK